MNVQLYGHRQVKTTVNYNTVGDFDTKIEFVEGDETGTVTIWLNPKQFCELFDQLKEVEPKVRAVLIDEDNVPF